MDEYLKASIVNRLNATAKALEKNHFEAYVVNDHTQLLALLKQLIPHGASICSGGSMTLKETGVLDLLQNGDYNYYSRSRTDSDGNPVDVYLKAFSSDWYFTGSNAVTLDGELYNVDGNGNRVAAMTYGPKNVAVIVGCNKIVKDLDAARERIKAIAAPANCIRLEKKNGCQITGHCIDCNSDTRICCTATIHSFQRDTGRIKVFLLPEEFGY